MIAVIERVLAIVYFVVGIAAFSDSIVFSFLFILTAILLVAKRDIFALLPFRKSKKKIRYLEPIFLPYDEFVYVISNDAFESGIFKIGMTTQLPKERIAQINSATGVPQPFHFDLLLSAKNSRKLESQLHKQFNTKRVNDNREFFRLSQADVVEIVQSNNTLFVNYDHFVRKHSFDLLEKSETEWFLNRLLVKRL